MDLGIDFVSFSFIDNEEVKKKREREREKKLRGGWGGEGQRRNALTFLSDFEFF